METPVLPGRGSSESFLGNGSAVMKFERSSREASNVGVLRRRMVTQRSGKPASRGYLGLQEMKYMNLEATLGYMTEYIYSRKFTASEVRRSE